MNIGYPEGTTHETIAKSAIQFYQKTKGDPWKYWSKIHCVWKESANGAKFHFTELKPITQREPLNITCEDEWQVMLCEQIIRMCKGEVSEFNDDGLWKTVVNNNFIAMDFEYRLKPKKELVVPWGWLAPDVTAITVNERGVVLAIDGSNQGWEIKLNLDLTDIELPITVTRPV